MVLNNVEKKIVSMHRTMFISVLSTFIIPIIFFIRMCLALVPFFG